MNIKRYHELAEIQKHDLLTPEEQAEYIAISTKILYAMMKTDEDVTDILMRLRNR
jgi:hypothetical protein